MKGKIFWDVTQCFLIEVCRRFGGAKQAGSGALRHVPKDLTFRKIMQNCRKMALLM
jgi:hypothetical protein